MTCENQPFTARGAAGMPSRALAHQDLGGDLWRGPVGLPLSPLVESIAKGPMSLECGLAIEQGVSNPGRWVPAFSLRGFNFRQA